MQTLPGIFLEVQTRDSNFFGSAASWDLDPTVLGQGLVVLGDLIALGQIGIEIVFTGKDRCLVNPAIYRHGSEHGEFDRFAVQNRQGTW